MELNNLLKMRTITEILIDADNAETIGEIGILWEEIESNFKKYPSVQLCFAEDHIAEICKAMAKRDSRKIQEIIRKIRE